MKANPKVRVEVEGHCDDIGSAEYNLALGAKRAQVAKDFLVIQGIDSDRLVTISYGKEAPACFDQTEECRVKNRRARFVMFTELPTS
jgi:peptidoglycan-associated lipoprotein